MSLMLYMGKGRVLLVIVADFSGVFNSVSGVLESGMATVGAGYVFVRKRRHLFKGVLGFGLCREVGGIGYR